MLYGPLDRPQILYGAARRARTADYLAELAEGTLRARTVGGAAALSIATKTPVERAPRIALGGQKHAAFFTVFGIFFLTLLLAGQAVGTMAEERGNKVIEVLAAAVPLESVFLGKLLGMFGVAILFVALLGHADAARSARCCPQARLPPLPTSRRRSACRSSSLLFFAYFAMAYMLLGAVFLGVGAQASTVREIQMLSLPVTILQVAMFGLASTAASQPGQLGCDLRRDIPPQFALCDGGARGAVARTLAACSRFAVAAVVGRDRHHDRRARVPARRTAIG